MGVQECFQLKHSTLYRSGAQIKKFKRLNCVKLTSIRNNKLRALIKRNSATNLHKIVFFYHFLTSVGFVGLNIMSAFSSSIPSAIVSKRTMHLCSLTLFSLSLVTSRSRFSFSLATCSMPSSIVPAERNCFGVGTIDGGISPTFGN